MNAVVPDPDLLRACLAAPLDAAPRLVLADWLEERGWGDRLLVAALRGDGDWAVGHKRRVVWESSEFCWLVEKAYPEGTVVIEYGDDPPTVRIGMGRSPDGVTCAACRRTAELDPDSKGRMTCWQHRAPVRFGETTGRVVEPGSFPGAPGISIVTHFAGMGGVIPQSWVRQQLDLPEPSGEGPDLVS